MPVVGVVTEEAKEQLVEASAVTKKAFTTYRREAEAEEHQAAAEGAAVPAADKGQEEGEMSVIITIMQPILRLMQLLCENHNRDLQVSHETRGAVCCRAFVLIPPHHPLHVNISRPVFGSLITALTYTEMKPC